MTIKGIIAGDASGATLYGTPLPLCFIGGSYRIIDPSISFLSRICGKIDVVCSCFHKEIERYIKNHEANRVSSLVSVIPSGYVYGSGKTLSFSELIKASAEEEDKTVDAFAVCSSNVVFNENAGKIVSLFEKHGKTLVLSNEERTLPFFLIEHDLLIYYLKKDQICGLPDKGNRYFAEVFAEKVDGERDYYDMNMRFVNEPLLCRGLFEKEDDEIISSCYNAPPAAFGENADVSSAVFTDGCVINGSVKNSVLLPFSRIEDGAVIKNCVVLPGRTVKSGEICENTVVK